ncbi:MAG: Choline-sulfatase, partial [Myxococcaceae bacterium]|nr:Choline-sulfatase [Myxococcaceae bacterium]
MRRLLLVAARMACLASLACVACSKRPPPESTPDASAAVAASSTPAPVAKLNGGPVDAGPSASAADHPWNVVLLSIDSLRADMPWAGYERPIAPRLSALQAKSISYSHAYSTSSFTSKSIPGLLTGRYPSELARTGYFFTKYVVPGEFVCTALDAQDIPCIGGHAHAYFDKGQSGFENGFRKWRIVPGIAFDYQTDPYVTSDKLTPLAIEMLADVASTQDAGAKPFFAWFHFMDPHDEYKTHAESPHFGKRPRDLYDEEVFFTDLWIGKLLDWIDAQPWAARTAIIVTADHGEAFGEHGITRHAHEVWEELIHVPLFVQVPGLAPREIAASRGHADVAPTVLELLGAQPIASLHGTSL